MRLRFGFFAGFATGYYLGAMAGRERYQQLNRLIGRAKRSDAMDVAADKAKAAVDLGVEKAKEGVQTKLHQNGKTEQGSSSKGSSRH